MNHITPLESMRKIVSKMKQEFESAPSGSLEDNRRRFDEQGLKFPVPDTIEISPVIINSVVDGEKYTHKNQPPSDTTVLYFHGGGYSVGSTLSHRLLCTKLALAANSDVVSINYRLAPEHKFPSALDDASASFEWLKDQGCKTENIFVAGDSAGGGLAMALLIKLNRENADLPAGGIGISPWLDLECTSKSYTENQDIDLLATAEGLRFVGRAYANKQINTNPLISPFYAINEDLQGLCPLLLQIGSAETLRDEVIAFGELATNCGVDTSLHVWPNMVHVWHSLFGVIPEAEAAVDEIAAWINRG